MKVFAVLLVALATAFSQGVGEEGSSAVKIVFQTLLGPKTCQGTLIDSGNVLTSAGCCLGSISAKVSPLYDLSIITTVFGTAFKIHPIYGVCIVPVTFNPPLLNNNYLPLYDGDIEVGEVITSVTWGRTPQQQQQIQVQFMKTVPCPIFESNPYIHDRIFCSDKCDNYSGAGIAGNGSLLGVVSWGHAPDASYCAHVKVSEYKDWIESNI